MNPAYKYIFIFYLVVVVPKRIVFFTPSDEKLLHMLHSYSPTAASS
jgi:hypothetical protein